MINNNDVSVLGPRTASMDGVRPSKTWALPILLWMNWEVFPRCS